MTDQLSTEAESSLGHRRSNSTDSGFDSFSRSFSSTETQLTHRRHNSAGGDEHSLLQNVITFFDPNPLLPQKVLCCLLDYILDNVLIKVTKHTKKYILIEFWKLIPHEVSFNLKSKHSRWSKRGLCDAFIAAEKEFPEICVTALSTFVNFKKEPFLIDVLLCFLEQNFINMLSVSGAANRMLETEVLDASQIISPRIIIRQYTSWVSSSPNLQYFEFGEECPVTNTKSLHIKRQCFEIFSIGLFITFISCYCINVIYYHKNFQQNSQIMMILQGVNASTQKNSTISKVSQTELPPLPVLPNRYMIIVHSYNQYQQAMFKLKFDREVSLTISLENDEYWPSDFPAGNIHMICELHITAGTSISKIFNVLQVVSSADKITILNKSSLIFQSVETFDNLYRQNIISSKVLEFRLVNQTECTNFYKAISEIIVLIRMNHLCISTGVFTKDNIMYIRKLISYSRDTLKSIDFTGCKWFASLFENNVVTYLNVEMLRIYFNKRSRGDQNIIYLNKNIHHVFPNLKKFLSMAGHIEINVGMHELQQVKSWLEDR